MKVTPARICYFPNCLLSLLIITTHQVRQTSLLMHALSAALAAAHAREIQWQPQPPGSMGLKHQCSASDLLAVGNSSTSSSAAGSTHKSGSAAASKGPGVSNGLLRGGAGSSGPALGRGLLSGGSSQQRGGSAAKPAVGSALRNLTVRRATDGKVDYLTTAVFRAWS